MFMALKQTNKNRKKVKQKNLPPLQYVDIDAIKALDHEQLKAHIDKAIQPVTPQQTVQPPFIESNDHSYKFMLALSVVMVLVLVI